MSYRDYNLFENLFKASSIAKCVVNSAIMKFSVDDLQIKGNIRQRVRYLLTASEMILTRTIFIWKMSSVVRVVSFATS